MAARAPGGRGAERRVRDRRGVPARHGRGRARARGGARQVPGRQPHVLGPRAGRRTADRARLRAAPPAPHRFVLSACDSGVHGPRRRQRAAGAGHGPDVDGYGGDPLQRRPRERRGDGRADGGGAPRAGRVRRPGRRDAAGAGAGSWATSSASRRPRLSWRWGSDRRPDSARIGTRSSFDGRATSTTAGAMSIGISEEHVELARSLREWAASLGGREAARDAEGDAGGDVRRLLEGLRRDGRGHDRAARVVRRGRRLGARPGGGAGGVRARAGARPAALDRGRRPRRAVPQRSATAPLSHWSTTRLALAGDLAGATHVLGADGLVALARLRLPSWAST